MANAQKLVISKSNRLNEGLWGRMIPTESRLINMMLGKVNPKQGEGGKLRVWFLISEFEERHGLAPGSVRKERLRECLERLKEAVVLVKDGEGYKAVHLLESYGVSCDSRKAGYRWQVYMECSHEAIGMLYDIDAHKGYTGYSFEDIARLRSPRANRAYDLAKQWQKTGETEIGLEDLKGKLGLLPGAYPKFSDFRLRVLEPAQKAINGTTDIHIEFERVHKNGSPGGKTHAIKLLVRKNEANAEKKATAAPDSGLGEAPDPVSAGGKDRAAEAGARLEKLSPEPAPISDNAPIHIRKMYDECNGEFGEPTIKNIDRILAKCEVEAARPGIAEGLYGILNHRDRNGGVDRRGGYIVTLAELYLEDGLKALHRVNSLGLTEELEEAAREAAPYAEEAMAEAERAEAAAGEAVAAGEALAAAGETSPSDAMSESVGAAEAACEAAERLAQRALEANNFAGLKAARLESLISKGILPEGMAETAAALCKESEAAAEKANAAEEKAIAARRAAWRALDDLRYGPIEAALEEEIDEPEAEAALEEGQDEPRLPEAEDAEADGPRLPEAEGADGALGEGEGDARQDGPHDEESDEKLEYYDRLAQGLPDAALEEGGREETFDEFWKRLHREEEEGKIIAAAAKDAEEAHKEAHKASSEAASALMAAIAAAQEEGLDGGKAAPKARAAYEEASMASLRAEEESERAKEAGSPEEAKAHAKNAWAEAEAAISAKSRAEIEAKAYINDRPYREAEALRAKEEGKEKLRL